MIYQEFDSGKINHFLGSFISLLIVSCETSESIQPCESSLDHPSKRLRRESLCTVRCVTDFNIYVEIFFYLIGHISSVTSVNEYLPEGRPEKRGILTDRPGEFGIMMRRIVNSPPHDESITVYHDTALHTFDLFIGIKAVVTHPVTPPDALRIKRSCDRNVILPVLLPDPHNRLFYKKLDTSVISPFTEELIHRLPFGKILREHTPLTSADQQIKYSLKDGAQRIFTVSAIIFKEYFLYIRPLTLTQMCLIVVYFMYMNFFSPINTLVEGFVVAYY